MMPNEQTEPEFPEDVDAILDDDYGPVGAVHAQPEPAGPGGQRVHRVGVDVRGVGEVEE